MKEVFMEVEFANQQIDKIPAGYIDKSICGCGMTTVAIENDVDTIIAVPRIGLITNKCLQYPNERSKVRIFPVTGKTKHEDIDRYLRSAKVVKIIVTYDSLPKVEHLLDRCHLVIDESNMLFSDARLKKKVPYTVLKLAEKYKSSVSFITATPIPLKYLPNWISDIEYIKYHWTNTRKAIPLLCKRRSPLVALKEEFIIPLLQNGTHSIRNYTFRKLIIFINNIEQVVDIVRELKISPDQCGIICGDNVRNDSRIRGIPRYTITKALPILTFVTSSGFQGIDLYDDTAMTVIVGNASQEFQMLDAFTDIKQAVSRQRNKENPNFGVYVFIYNQAVFEKSEAELLSGMDAIKKKIEHNIPHYEAEKAKGDEDKFMIDREFERYTLFEENTYHFIELAYNADLHFIVETRRQYEKGFNYATQFEDSIVIPPPVDANSDITFAGLVKYFNKYAKDGECDWSPYTSKTEWISTITDCYLYYGKVWENYSFAKRKLEHYGDSYELIKEDVRSALIPGKQYRISEVTHILQRIYDEHRINRKSKFSDVGIVFTWQAKKIRGNRWIAVTPK